MNEQTDKLLTVNDVARQLQIKPGTVRLWIREKRIEAINVKPDATRPVYRVRESVVTALLSHTTNA